MDFFDVPDDVLMSDTEALASAYARGRGGVAGVVVASNAISSITGAPPFPQGEPIVSMLVEPQHARTWVVTLLGQKWSGDPTATQAANADNGVTPFQGLAYAKLQYGTSEAQEEVLFDYPWGGVTFQVTASFVRIYAPGLPLSVQNPRDSARLGGFITGKNCSLQSQPSRLTFTAPIVNVAAAGGTGVFVAPRRAVGYRVFTPAFVAAALNTVNLVQLGSGSLGAPNGVDALNMQPDGIQGPPAEEGFFRLFPGTAGVQITNNDPTNLRQYGLIWLLDVG